MIEQREFAGGFMRRNPLVLAVGVLVMGVLCGIFWDVPVELALGGGLMGVAVWGAAEGVLAGRVRTILAHAGLVLGLWCLGIGLWQLNQRYGGNADVARFVQSEEAVAVSLRVEVAVPPEEGGRHGNVYWVGRVRGIRTDGGWVEGSGDVRVKSAAGVSLLRGEVYQVQGWAKRVEGPRNPGGFDLRAYLGASRIFVEVSARKGNALTLMEEGEGGAGWLERARRFVRGKLLEHTVRVDGVSARAMVALLLGYRDPAISQVSEAFVDAGVAHLLAISGSHVVFLAGILWGISRVLPGRPRAKFVGMGMILLAYVLLTPCGPPVVRAGIAMGMLVVGRLMSRRGSLLNMLAAALAVVVIVRPADVLDAGCQLSFVSTAGLLLLGERCFAWATGWWWMRREEEIVGICKGMPGSWFWRWRLWGMKLVIGLLVANGIGTLTATPLVVWHFQQWNPLAMGTGIVALPLVSVTMVASLVQLVVAMLSSSAAEWIAPVTTGCATGMVWVVEQLARLPGAAMALRAPPAWMVMGVYGVMVGWVVRKRVGMSRASVAVAMVAAMTGMVGWYAMTERRGELVVDVMTVSEGSSVIVRMPDGGVWAVNCGSREVPNVFGGVTREALREMGVGRVEGVMVSGLDTVHASGMGELVGKYRPARVFVSEVMKGRSDWTLAGTRVMEEGERVGAKVVGLQAGDEMRVGECGVKVVWPEGGAADGVLMWRMEFAGKAVWFVDPKGGMDWRSLRKEGDVVVLLGPGKGEGGMVVGAEERRWVRVKVLRGGGVEVERH